MTTKVLLPGHDEVSLEGENFKPNELGIFSVPDHLAHILIQQHGGISAVNVLTRVEEEAAKVLAEAEAKAKAEAEALLNKGKKK